MKLITALAIIVLDTVMSAQSIAAHDHGRAALSFTLIAVASIATIAGFWFIMTEPKDID